MANILIVDDDEMDRLLERTFLEDAGHTPFFASDGEAALRVYQTNDINPAVKIIAVSGAAADQLGEAEAEGALSGLIKPVQPDQLVQAVQEALDGSGGSDAWGSSG